MAARIYTKTGDTGSTGLFGGQRVAKDDMRVEAYGAVDELNASIGAVRASQAIIDSEIDAILSKIQHDLFQLGADLATPTQTSTSAGKSTVRRVQPERVLVLEQAIDQFEAELTSLTRFVLPGGTAVAAALHVSRTVCRRAERRTVALAGVLNGEPRASGSLNPEIVRYLNRLSDLLFVLARAANSRARVPDVYWNPEV